MPPSRVKCHGAFRADVAETATPTRKPGKPARTTTAKSPNVLLMADRSKTALEARTINRAKVSVSFGAKLESSALPLLYRARLKLQPGICVCILGKNSLSFRVGCTTKHHTWGTSQKYGRSSPSQYTLMLRSGLPPSPFLLASESYAIEVCARKEGNGRVPKHNPYR